MSILEALITNRTAADVSRWRTLRDKGLVAMSEAEKAEWLAGMRGAFNAADRNRITEAMVYLKGLYEQYGREVTYTPVYITHADGTTDTTWRIEDIPTDAQLSLMIQNLQSFWAGVESASGNVVEVWADTSFGYVEMSAEISAGNYVSLSAVHGITEIRVEVQSGSLSSITAAGTGWTIEASDSVIVAKYSVPQGVFQDIQDALDTLVFLCSAEECADATVTVSALMRSGNTVQIGSGAIHWSAIINWEAFEAYAYTWQDIENAQMTWADLEGLPIPGNGGST